MSSIKCFSIQFNKIHDHSMEFNAIQCNSIQNIEFNAIENNSMKFNAMQCHPK